MNILFNIKVKIIMTIKWEFLGLLSTLTIEPKMVNTF